MDKLTTVKTVGKEFPDKIASGIAWFTFITAINNIHLSRRELELLAFINSRGTISSISAKDEFCKIFGTSKATISNMVSKLSSFKLLVKEKSKTRINPSIRVDFSNDLFIKLFIKTKEETENAS
jgi:hypothetical protein